MTSKSNVLAPASPSASAKLVKSDSKVLDCKLSEREVLERTHDLGARLKELKELDDKLALLKDERRLLVQRGADLQEEIGTHQTRRPVTVEEWADPSLGIAITQRADTGQELSRRTLTPGERQGDLDLQ